MEKQHFHLMSLSGRIGVSRATDEYLVFLICWSQIEYCVLLEGFKTLVLVQQIYILFCFTGKFSAYVGQLEMKGVLSLCGLVVDKNVSAGLIVRYAGHGTFF